MPKYLNKKLSSYILSIIAIILVNGKNIKENELFNSKSINYKKKVDLIQPINKKLEISKYNQLNWIYEIEDYNADVFKNDTLPEGKIMLTLNERNIINLSDTLNNYYLNLSDIKEEISKNNNIQLLLYTNLTNNIFFNYSEDKKVNISTFYIISNNIIIQREILEFEVYKKNGIGQGFLDILLLNNETEEFIFNNGISRKKIFNDTEIQLIEKEKKAYYYINTNPIDKKTDLFYFLFSFKDISNEEKKKVKFYYLNDFKNYTLKKIMDNIRKEEKKRGWKLSGNSEIIVFEYKELKKSGNLELEYKQIKGEGTLGFILTISILFALFIITLGVFLKNGYFGYTKIDSDGEKIN